MALIEKLSAIGNAIREKTGGTELLTLDQMPGEIAGIETGGNGGIGAVKFIDVDITIDASTTTVVTYTVDNLDILSSVENPGSKYTAFTNNDAYIVFISPKEITGVESGAFTTIYHRSMHIMYGNNNCTANVVNLMSNGVSSVSVTNYGIHTPTVYCTDVTNGKKTGYLTVNVRHHATNGYEVVPGVYNVQVWHLTDWDWGIES